MSMGAVLLVEGCATDRERLSAILAAGGFDVHALEDCRDVAARLDEIRPLALLLGAELAGGELHPVLDGEAGLPVLLLTLRDDDPAVVAGLRVGLADSVCKAAPPELILARLGRLVRLHQLAAMSRINEQLVQIGRLLLGIVHEIRGPLSVIRGNAEMMRLCLGDQHECHRWVDPILRNAQLLQLRLEHLMAAVRAGPPVLVPVEIPPLVREAAELFLKGTDPRRSKLSVTTEFADDLPRPRADAGRLLLVLLNLLSNAQDAASAVQAEVRIVVRADVVEEAGQRWLTIAVRDNGPGIPAAVLDRIFEPFFTTKSSGTGYGLYLASESLREHGGRISAHNPEGGGACLTAWLPLAADAPEGTTAGPA
jgi:signal transduction histidine kinase